MTRKAADIFSQFEHIRERMDQAYRRVLHLLGTRPPLPGRPRMSYSQMEIAHGPFRRELLLPAEVNAEAAVANYHDGILEVVLPKAPTGLHRQLRIVAR